MPSRRGLGPSLPPKFEVILDYKGMRRPPVPTPGAPNSLWTQYEWQLQTYGELRRTQPDALTVVAGVLLYVNELHPTRSDLEHLKERDRTRNHRRSPVARLAGRHGSEGLEDSRQGALPRFRSTTG